MKKDKGQAEFGWIFALIIGAVILFLALFAASRIFSTGERLSSAEMIRSFDIILNPFASMGSIASLTLSKDINMPYEVEIGLGCDAIKNVQNMGLRTIEKGKKGEWINYTIKNKYVFSSQSIKGKSFSTFSKPFNPVWRVDDLIYLISGKYCFVNPPSKIKEELDSVESTAIYTTTSTADCITGEKKVCFNPNDYVSCDLSKGDVKVNYNSYLIEKNGGTYYFLDDASMYAAIFSDKQIYDCNMKRLIKRLAVQARIYYNQAQILKDCADDSLLRSLSLLATDAESASSEIINYQTVQNIKDDANAVKRADNLNCPIIGI